MNDAMVRLAKAVLARAGYVVLERAAYERLCKERDAYLNDLRISNEVGHEWADRAQARAAALVKIQALIGRGLATSRYNCVDCVRVQKLVTEAIGVGLPDQTAS